MHGPLTPRRIHGLMTPFLLLLCVVLSGCAGPRWSAVEWHGEKAWISRHGGWHAVVSETRARLVHLGPEDSDINLLYASEGLGPDRPRGGHLVWLGPQSAWNGRWGAWPPPAEWEQLPARAIRVNGAWLHLEQPRPDVTRPALCRAYRWENDALLCRVSWSGGIGDHQAIQIFQLPSGAVVEVARVSPAARDFVRFGTDGLQRHEHPAMTDAIGFTKTGARVSSRQTAVKYGFLPQPLVARINGCVLTMERGAIEGAAVDFPDGGFETQVYVGGATFPFVEIEQLTPRLRRRDAGKNAFTIRLSLLRLAPVP